MPDYLNVREEEEEEVVEQKRERKSVPRSVRERYILYTYLHFYFSTIHMFAFYDAAIFNLKLHYAAPIPLNAELRCRVSELCTIARIHCKCMEVFL